MRDKEQREVDFVVTYNRRVQLLIEVKSSEAKISSGFHYYQKKLKPKKSIQLVHNLNRSLEKDGIEVLSLSSWLESFTLALL